MTFEIALLLCFLGVALFFFAFEWVPADAVALGLLVALVLTGLIPASKAFLGFGSDTVMMIFGLLVLTAALMRTGVVDLAGGTILRYTGTGPVRLLLVIMLASACLGAFMSNTASTAFFVPVVFGIAKKAAINPGKLLLPLAFSSILSSSVTLISTSTNIVVSGLMQNYGMEPMGMFELAPVGLPIATMGLLYMLYIGRHLIPDRVADANTIDFLANRPYLTEILILPTSKLIGRTLEEAGLGRDLGLTILRIVRNKDQYLVPNRSSRLQSGDILLVEGGKEEILKIKDTAGIDIKADVKLSDPHLQTEESALVEVIVMTRSPLVGRTLKNFGFRERFGLQVLAINRHGRNLRRKISQTQLRMGDVLLVQGARTNIAALEEDHAFRILTAVEERRPNFKRAPLAITIFLGVLLLATLKIVAFPVAVILGSVLVFVTRCITPEEAYREIEWKALILIGSMLALGTAMDETGAAKYLAGLIADFSASHSSIWVLAGFFVLTVVLTQPMSNQAAAVVLIPVAIQTALKLGLNPRSFAMMIAVAASCSYLTPLEPSCLMVYGPGNYRFRDFFLVGAPLTLLIGALALWLVPRFWPLIP